MYLFSATFGNFMKITKDKVVSLAYQVRTAEGVIVDEATITAPLEYLHGHNSLIPGLEKALENHEVGDKFNIDLASADAYGDFNDNLVQNVPKNVFVGIDDLEVGMRFLADTDHGPVPVEITAIDGDTITVDGNHMLAGQDLKFDVEILAIRNATEEEIAKGHLHSTQDEDEPQHHKKDNNSCCGGGCNNH